MKWFEGGILCWAMSPERVRIGVIARGCVTVVTSKQTLRRK